MRELARTFLLALGAGALVGIMAVLWRLLDWMPELVRALRVIASELTRLRQLQDPAVAPAVPGRPEWVRPVPHGPRRGS